MSSKLYKKYLSLKIEDSSKLYLFKSGIFYIFIADDAKIVAPLLELKLTNLNSVIMKCGFPINSQEKYFKKINDLNLKVEIVSLLEDFYHSDLANFTWHNKILSIINDFLKINVNDLSISEAFDVLNNLQNNLKQELTPSKHDTNTDCSIC